MTQSQPNQYEDCYCVCHNPVSSCPSCEHCKGVNNVTRHQYEDKEDELHRIVSNYYLSDEKLNLSVREADEMATQLITKKQLALLDELEATCIEKVRTEKIPLSNTEHGYNIATQDIRKAIVAKRQSLTKGDKE